MLAAAFTAAMLAIAAGPTWAADSATPQAAPGATFQIEVIGAVLHPGKVELKDGDRVSLAIARAGVASTANPDLTHVCVAHMATVNEASSATEVFAPSVECVNLYKWLAQGSQASNPVLHPGDVVVVMSSQKAAVQQPT
jgi:protein involved in polysaccharide export with SLBB domain